MIKFLILDLTLHFRILVVFLTLNTSCFLLGIFLHKVRTLGSLRAMPGTSPFQKQSFRYQGSCSRIRQSRNQRWSIYRRKGTYHPASMAQGNQGTLGSLC